MATLKAGTDQREAMDRMYRLTRHIYDLTRKYYLLGRDQLLRQMEVRPGDHVIEIGCGTARNLIGLARLTGQLKPGAHLYGLDASSQMLETAQKKIAGAGLADTISLQVELAENLDFNKTFGLSQPFDVVFFSYSLSIIPTWELALEAGLKNLAPGRTLYIVDFWDQGDLPGWFAGLLKGWLRRFGVYHKPELLARLRSWESQKLGTLKVQSVARRYAYIAEFVKQG